MKRFFLLIAVLFLIPLITLGQTKVKRNYKVFTDTSFKAGDIILTPEILFYVGSCEMLAGSKDSVNIIASFIKTHPSFNIEIGVHTDSRGTPAANIKLSECRANSILGYLTKELFLPAGNLAVKGYGSQEPVITDEEIRKAYGGKIHHDLNLYQKNRRVEIKILKTP